MTQYEDFPKKCLKCKKANVPLEKFQIAYVKKKYNKWGIFSRLQEILYNSNVIKFPVCKKCKNKFERYRTVVSLFYVISLLNIPTLFISLFLVFNPNITITFPFNILPFIISLTLAIIFGIIGSIDPNRISNYIEVMKDGSVVIKDPNYNKEMDDYRKVKLVEDELGIDQIYCPNCKSLISRDVDFCNFCGKDLRSI